LTLSGCCTLEPRVTLVPAPWRCPARAADLLAHIDEAGLVLRCDEPEPDER
jgi:hypothetical protein